MLQKSWTLHGMWMVIGTTAVLAASSAPSTICVAPLNNNTGDDRYDALAESFADVLAVTLGDLANVTVVERQLLRKVLAEQQLSLAALTDPATAAKVGKILKADRILIGGITKLKDRLVVSVHVCEIQTSQLVTTVQAQGKATNLAPVINDLVGQLGKRLDVKLKPIDSKDLDKNPNASLHFMRGLGYYYAGHYDRAIMEFMKTQNMNPLSDKAGYFMALCFTKTGEFDHARIELSKLTKQFPRSPLRGKAQRLIDTCKKHTATQPTAIRTAPVIAVPPRP